MQTESTIIDEFRRGTEKGLNKVFQLYNRPLLYFSLQFVKRRQVAEEVVSDIFVKAWKLRNNFEDINKLKAFLYISVKNASLNYLRSSYARHEINPIEEWEDLECLDSDIFVKIVKTELIKSIYDEMSRLPEKQREVFILTFIEDLEVEEISKKLGISASAVYANKSRAIAALRNNLRPSHTVYLWLLIMSFQ